LKLVCVKKVSAWESEYFFRTIHIEHEPSLDKLMAFVSKRNLVSPKKFSHEDLSEITKSTQFSRAVRKER